MNRITPFRPQLTATVIPCEEGGFTAFCPQIKGAISEGETEEEAVENLKDAIAGVLAVNAEMTEECISSYRPQSGAGAASRLDLVFS